MGLDMYLNAKRFVWHNEDKLSDKISKNFPELGDKKIKQVVAEAGYWRKANQIHKWFVDNVQNGEDDCGNYEVTKENLKKLLDIIEEVLSDRSKAKTLLPSASGFFFGGTDYDDYYYDDLEYTKDLLHDILDNNWEGWYFEYHSSW